MLDVLLCFIIVCTIADLKRLKVLIEYLIRDANLYSVMADAK